jgi:hypothetical protein
MILVLCIVGPLTLFGLPRIDLLSQFWRWGCPEEKEAPELALLLEGGASPSLLSLQVPRMSLLGPKP